MKVLLVLCAVLASQQLTWYELYERGEKRFAREDYRLCIEDMNEALKLKPESERNVFTRAVQKIDYKPFYYRAMAYYRLGNLSEAYRDAQLAFKAPVVREFPLLQSDLAKILEDYSEWMAEEHTRFERERLSLEEKQRVTKLAAEGQLQEAVSALERLEESDPAAVADLRRLLESQLKFEREERELRKNLFNSINQAIQAGSWFSARKLIELGSENLPPDAVTQWLDQIAKGEAFEMANAKRETASATEEPKDPEFNKEALEENIRLLEDFQRRIKESKDRENELSAEISRMESRNDVLTRQLEAKSSATPALPRLVLTAQPTTGRRIQVQAQVLSELPIQEWDLHLNGKVLNVADADWLRDPEGMALNTEIELPGFGSFSLVLKAKDALGRPVENLRTIVLPMPFWYQPWFRYCLVMVPLLLAILYILSWFARRRSARLKNFNPYIAGSPVREKEMFYGRDQLLARIQGLVHKNCFMIHGERRIGKTSLLLQLKTNLEHSESSDYAFFPAFVDLQGIREEELFHHLMGEILAQAADWPIETHDFDFRDDFENYQNRQFSRDMKRVIGRLRETTPKHVVVVLLVDEVDVLNEFGDKTNQKLRGIFMKEYAEFLSCVMAGIHLKKEWESSGSPWYNFFEEIPIDSIDERAAKKLILRPVRGIFKYQAEAVAQILRASGGHPYLIQKLCVSLVDESLRQKRFLITKEDVERYLSNLRKESQEKGTA